MCVIPVLRLGTSRRKKDDFPQSESKVTKKIKSGSYINGAVSASSLAF